MRRLVIVIARGQPSPRPRAGRHSMELLLNSLWLLLAIAALLFWRSQRYAHTCHRSHGRILAIVALACTFVVLFPVISVTDDLHAEQVTMDDSSRPLMKARNMVNGCLRAASSLFVMHAPPRPAAAVVLRWVISLIADAATVHSCPSVSAHEGRSPPAR